MQDKKNLYDKAFSISDNLPDSAIKIIVLENAVSPMYLRWGMMCNGESTNYQLETTSDLYLLTHIVSTIFILLAAAKYDALISSNTKKYSVTITMTR